MTEDYGAFLADNPGYTDGDYVDVKILSESGLGDDFYAATAITTDDISDGRREIRAAQEEAEELMRRAGWALVDGWISVDCGWAATVERDA